MIIHTIERLQKGLKPVDVDVHLEAIDFLGSHMEEEYKDTTIAVMRSGVVLWLNIKRSILRKMMANAK